MAVDLANSAAWDDGELVRAYDAAMDEFHIHHPGPGTWLDKATAALAKGQPLPEAHTFGSEWYAANRAASPVYVPPSPPASTREEPLASIEVESAMPIEAEPAEAVTESGQPHDTSSVTFEQAMSYAMSAQYMAGYWMGVAQSKKQAANVTSK